MTSDSGGGGGETSSKNYYPTIEELLQANNSQFSSFMKKLSKDYVICSLRDTVSHLREAKVTSSFVESINQNIETLKDKVEMLSNAHEKSYADISKLKLDIKPQTTEKTPIVPSIGNTLRIQGIPEDTNKSRDENVIDTDKKVRNLLNELGVNGKTSEVRRLGKFNKSQTRDRKLLVTIDCEHDAKLLLAKTPTLYNLKQKFDDQLVKIDSKNDQDQLGDSASR